MINKTTSPIIVDDITAFVAQLDVFNLLGSSVCVLGTEHDILFENDAFIKFNLTLRDSVDNLNTYTCLFSCPILITSIDTALHDKRTFSLKHRFYYSTNIHVDLNIVFTPIVNDKTDNIQGLLCTVAEESIDFNNKGLAKIQDKVTTLKNRIKILDNDIKNSNNFIKFLFKDAPLAIVLFNLDRKIVNINKHAEKLFNISANESIGKDCTGFLNCYNRCNSCPVLSSDQKRIDIDKTESYGIDDTTIPLLRSAVRFRNQDEELILEAFMDMREVEQAKLESREKSMFLANMSHEIRTPLTAIIGFSESLLTEDFESTQQNRIIDTIIRNGKHLQHVINDILDLSKIESGQLEIELINTSPFLILGEVDSMMGPLARDKGLIFKINYHFPLPAKIKTDPTRLKQILINLCSNAIKFTHSGSITIDVTCNSNYSQIFFQITDTGNGMTSEEKDRVFNPFSQADTTTTRKYGGTGLGLTISRQLAAELSGSLNCSSEKAKGSSFTLDIATHCPLKVVPIKSLKDVSLYHDEQFVETEIRLLDGEILLAEDSPDNQQLIQMYIRKTGARIKVVENGRDAVKLALSHQFDLILMDMQMPVMDGLQAITALRASGYSKPIVTLTANAMMSDRNKCIAEGANDYLVKPINLNHFYTVLNTYLPNKIEQDIPKNAINAQIEFQNNPAYMALVKNFIKELPETINHLRLAITNNDWQTAILQSHDLKGMGGSMGFPQITEIATDINTELKQKNYDRASIIIDALELHCKEVVRYKQK